MEEIRDNFVLDREPVGIYSVCHGLFDFSYEALGLARCAILTEPLRETGIETSAFDDLGGSNRAESSVVWQ